MNLQKSAYILLSYLILGSYQLPFASASHEANSSTPADPVKLPSLAKYSTHAGKTIYTMLCYMEHWLTNGPNEDQLYNALEKHNLLPQDPFFSSNNITFKTLLLKIANAFKNKSLDFYISKIVLTNGENIETRSKTIYDGIEKQLSNGKISEKFFNLNDIKNLIKLFDGLSSGEKWLLNEDFKM